MNSDDFNFESFLFVEVVGTIIDNSIRREYIPEIKQFTPARVFLSVKHIVDLLNRDVTINFKKKKDEERVYKLVSEYNGVIEHIQNDHQTYLGDVKINKATLAEENLKKSLYKRIEGELDDIVNPFIMSVREYNNIKEIAILYGNNVKTMDKNLLKVLNAYQNKELEKQSVNPNRFYYGVPEQHGLFKQTNIDEFEDEIILDLSFSSV